MGIKLYNADAESSDSILPKVGMHSHISGLGVSGGVAVSADGLIGQAAARRACLVVARMAKARALGGRGALLAGPPGSGKTALARALAAELGSELPFVALSASEVYSAALSKTEVLTQSLRRAVVVTLREEEESIEGEVVEVEVNRPARGAAQPDLGEALAPATTASWGVGIAAKLMLRTADMECVYDVGARMCEQIEKQDIRAGDVVRILRSTGALTKLGRTFESAGTSTGVDAATSGHVPLLELPRGELQRTRETVHKLSLHEIDTVNSKARGFLGLFSGATGELSEELRSAVDAKVAEWLEDGRASLAPGVLFLDECHLLDVECFSFLNRALELPGSPLCVFATNRGIARIRGTSFKSPHGMPLDLLDRLLIISTRPYDRTECRQILELRGQEEGARGDNEALELLAQLAVDCSLRYAIQLLTVSQVLYDRERPKVKPKENATDEVIDVKAAQSQKNALFGVKHVRKAYTLFLDVKRSTSIIMQAKNSYLFNQA